MNRSTFMRLVLPVVVLFTGPLACVDFDAEEQAWCQRNPERCGTQDAGDTEQDAGQDAGTDAGCVVDGTREDLPDEQSMDSNCDGIDGVVATALFVDPAR